MILGVGWEAGGGGGGIEIWKGGQEEVWKRYGRSEFRREKEEREERMEGKTYL